MRRLNRQSYRLFLAAFLAVSCVAAANAAGLAEAEKSPSWASAGNTAVVGAPVPVTAGPASSERLCEFPDQRVEGAVDSAWLVGDEGVASSDRLAFELQGVKGFLGTAPDFKSRTLYVVLGDPSDVVAGEAAVGRAAPSFRTVVVASCYPMAELDPLLKELSALVQGLNSEGANLSVGYEPRIGRIAVNLDPKTVDVRMVQGLLDKYGDLVQIVETSGIQRAARGSDASPHYGAASYGNSPNTPNCSSNATIIGIYGVRFMPTAGHCFTTAGANTWSGPFGYGIFQYRSPDYPATDIALLVAYSTFGEYFTNKIYTDPGSPTVRSVTGSGNPALGALVCLSGATSFAKCDYTINSTNLATQRCDSSGCTSNSFQAYTPIGLPRCIPGDSGGAIYTRGSGSTATMRGLVWGGEDVGIFGVRNCYFHPSSIVTQLGSYLTSP